MANIRVDYIFDKDFNDEFIDRIKLSIDNEQQKMFSSDKRFV
jgi:hypothetical protein